ncbi:hypothetical protein L0Z72_13255 [candidate division KSB1 bacterium]|nr:hypothetical protein [candidate division KSB1 bacterium]
MTGAKLSAKLAINFDSLPLPEKIILPITKGKIGGFEYEQHKSDPLSIEKLTFEFAGENRLKIKARGTGQLVIKNAPDLRIGGTKIHIEADLKIEDRKLRFLKASITRLDFPNIPAMFDKFLRDLFNKHLTKALEQDAYIDLQVTLENLRHELNRPIPFNMKVEKIKSEYFLELNSEPIEPEFSIDSQGICFILYADLNPLVKEKNQNEIT